MQDKSKTNSILLVEDDFDTRDSLSACLEEFGYDVFSAADAMTAIDILRKNKSPWLALVTDFNMPKINGVELIMSVKESGPQFDHMVLISAGGFEGLAPDFFQKEDVCLLRKPFALESLLSAVRR
jgi:DNA-binding NtrC family response regulator